jgi:thioredoxin 1
VERSPVILTVIGFLVPMALLLLLVSSCSTEKPSTTLPQVPVKGMVTMLDIGAMECVPCKMMAPIMKELEEEYKNKAAIVFIDVWKHRDQAPRFGIRAIPTQIFYDRDGKVVYRHEGFLDKDSIVSVLTKLGVQR